jgi:hypothetical protein
VRPNFAKAQWRKVSNSDSGGCAEVAYLDCWVCVRDPKDAGAGPVLAFNKKEWNAFLAGMANGEFTLERLAV